MKKLIALTLPFILLGCSSDSDENSNENNSTISIPSWLIGTWANEDMYSNDQTVNGFKIKNNDLCIYNSVEICHFEQANSMGYPLTIHRQISTENEYRLELKTGGQPMTAYHFIKIDDTHMKLSEDIDRQNANIVFVKVN